MTSDDNQSLQIEDLQVKIAFLEQAFSQLSDEYFAQQKEMQHLSLKLEALVDKLAKTDSANESSETVVDERPPHY